MPQIKLTKNYMQFSKGDQLDITSTSRVNSIEIIHNGRKFDIPRGHCTEISSTAGWTPPPIPTGGPPPAAPTKPTLSGLMGAQPTGQTAPVAPPSPTPAVPKMSLKDNSISGRLHRAIS